MRLVVLVVLVLGLVAAPAAAKSDDHFACRAYAKALALPPEEAGALIVKALHVLKLSDTRSVARAAKRSLSDDGELSDAARACARKFPSDTKLDRAAYS